MLHEKLLVLFPDYQRGDWELRDTGAGQFISAWNRPEPQPNQAQIDAVSEAAADEASAKERFRRVFASSTRDRTLLAYLAILASKSEQQVSAELEALYLQKRAENELPPVPLAVPTPPQPRGPR